MTNPVRLAIFVCSSVLWFSACASGPHPAMTMASKDFECPMASLTRHQIFPNKQRIEGCGKEAIYIKGCSGYGADSKCDWVRTPAGP